MKFLFATIAQIVLLAAPISSSAHPRASLHYKDIKDVFNNLDGSALDVMEELSSYIDNDLAHSFVDQFGSIPKNHRIIGHGWSLDGSIPRDTLDLLETRYPGQQKEILKWWSKEAKECVAKFVKATGLPEAQAKALGSIAWDVHLLGDLDPLDNERIDLVLQPKEILNNLEKNLKLLFKGKPEYANEIIQDLRVAYRAGDDVSSQATNLFKALKGGKLGTKLGNAYGKTLAKNGSYFIEEDGLAYIDRIAGFSEKNSSLVTRFKSELRSSKVAQSAQLPLEDTPGSAPGCSKAMTKQAKSALESYHTQHPPKGVSNVRTTTGFLREGTLRNGKHAFFLTISEDAVKAGKAAGVMTFVISEGITTYAFLAGDISETDFCWETAKNGAAAIATGVATLVAVSLGAGPAGPVVLAIGIGAYIICDLAFSSFRQFCEGGVLTEDDLLGLLPDDLRRKVSGITYEGFDSIFEYSNKVSALDFIDDLGPGPLDGESGNDSILDSWDNKKQSVLEAFD